MTSPRQLTATAVVVVTAFVVAVAGYALGSRSDGARPKESSPEVGFARDMALHHGQAVEMAEAIRTRGTSEEIQRLAADIALGQQAQIGRMRGWLEQWDLAPTSTESMAWARESMSDMPGMASSEEVRQLDSLAPALAETLFLQLMIRHHRGGVHMAQMVLKRADRPEVRNLAQIITRSQDAEIEAMTELLRKRGASPPG